MGIGVVGIQTSQKKEQSGPPFVSGSADNGLSVDAVTGRIVLGNDVGDPAAPAALLSNREIITEDALLNLFSILLNSIQTGIATLLNGQLVQVFSANGSSPTVSVTDSASGTPNVSASVAGGLGGTASVNMIAAAGDSVQLAMTAGPDDLQVTANGLGTITWTTGTVPVMRLDANNFDWQVGSIGTFNTADFQISGTTTYRRFVQSQGAGTYNVDRNLDSGKLFRNAGATNFQLPSMAGANSRPGFVFRARVFNAGGVTITAPAGITINFGSLVTSASGTLFSTDVGACITITFDVDGWVTESFVGAWGLT